MKCEMLNEYIVKFDEQSCSYQIWQSSGIPCDHTLAIILSCREDRQTYAKPFYTLEAYGNTYAHVRNADFNQLFQFNPVEIDSDSENSDDDCDDVIKPPNRRRPTGTKKHRIKQMIGRLRTMYLAVFKIVAVASNKDTQKGHAGQLFNQ